MCLFFGFAKAVPANSKAVPANSKAVPANSKAVPANSKAVPANYRRPRILPLWVITMVRSRVLMDGTS